MQVLRKLYEVTAASVSQTIFHVATNENKFKHSTNAFQFTIRDYEASRRVNSKSCKNAQNACERFASDKKIAEVSEMTILNSFTYFLLSRLDHCLLYL